MYHGLTKYFRAMKDNIGKKVIGFHFEEAYYVTIGYTNDMAKVEGKEGIIVEFEECGHDSNYGIYFEGHGFYYYPADLVDKQLKLNFDKILKDRLNHLKSDLSAISAGKLTKRIMTDKAKELKTRIEEIEYIITKIKK